tara:strand:+ start:146 stop:1504 length:1359 start_codon:yes stop_codon:yes gene_type:complete
LKPNIIFLTIDALRADKTYGKNKTSITPHIDSLISKGVYFEQTFAAADQTGSSLASIFTSNFPITSGINQFNFSSKTETMLNTFKKSGYYINGFVPDHDFFKSLTENFDNSNIYEAEKKASWKRLDDGLGAQIIDNLTANKMKEPWFLYIHIMDIRPPFEAPDEFKDEKFGENNYEKLVSSIDIWIGKIIKKIELTNTLIILSADHGEYIPATGEYITGSSKAQRALRKSTKSIPGLGKIGLKAVMNLRFASQTYKKEILKRKLTPFQMRSFNTRGANTLYDETIRVPLIIAGYNITTHKIIPDLVRQVDIFPTLLDISELPKNNNVDGRSLLPLFSGKKLEEIPAYIETGINLGLLLGKKSEILGKIIGIRTSSYKYWRSRDDPKQNISLFHLHEDPKEENNIAKNNPNVIKKMEDHLTQLIEKSNNDKNKKMTRDDIEKAKELLLKLGYI